MVGNPGERAGFRTDINGLRAWAVVSVVLYHFGIRGFSGGFVGVDIFFVISGFLMTGIVVRRLEQGRFSLLGFYLDRARRIVPALVAVCAILMCQGWWVLLPPDYKTLSNHVIASLGFFSNFKYWDEAGYFDPGSHEKWLLHTWSLSVEWQFYLILPVVLAAVWAFRPGRVAQTWAVLIGLGLSLVVSVATTDVFPTTAFFLLHTRAWEMFAGGLVFLLVEKLKLSDTVRRVVEVAGLLLIVMSVLVFSQGSMWPGWRALLPVSASMLILAANRKSVWTGNWLAQWIGDRSYSIYLWHWVIYVALVYVTLQKSSLAVGAAILITLLLGHLSWLLVETPARRALVGWKPGRSALALFGIVAAVGVGALAVRLGGGVAGRFPAQIEAVAAEADDTNPRRGHCDQAKGVQSPRCVYGSGKLRAIFVGDSHAEAVITSIAAAAENAGVAVSQWTYTGCPTIRGTKHVPGSWLAQKLGYDCAGFVEWTIAELQKLPKDIPVVVLNRAAAAVFGDNKHDEEVPSVYFTKVYKRPEPEFVAEFSQNLVDTLCVMARDRPVYVVRPIPEMGSDVPKASSRAMAMGLPSDIRISLDAYHTREAAIWAAQDLARERCGVRILDPVPYLCHDGFCPGSRDGRPIYYDSDHLNEFGNKLLVPMFAEVFKSS
jgi:peptidoglycan/LPS O-acetylase OafA/YrhL